MSLQNHEGMMMIKVEKKKQNGKGLMGKKKNKKKNITARPSRH